MSKLHEKKEKKIGLLKASETLGISSLSDIKPILIKAFQNRVENLAPSDLIKNYQNQLKLFGPSSIDQRDLVKFDYLFYSVLPDYFKAIEFPPIAPLGTNSIITKVNQNNILSTIRGSEVIADSTTPLALEMANRRIKYKNFGNEENLATSIRVIRLQHFDENKGFRQHFRLYGLCSSGKEIAGSRFYKIASVKHIDLWLSFLEKLCGEGMKFENISVYFSDTNILQQIILKDNIPFDIVKKNSLNYDFDLFKEYNVSLPKKVNSLDELSKTEVDKYDLVNKLDTLKDLECNLFKPLSSKYNNINFGFDFNRKAGLGYYSGSCFHIFANNSSGNTVQLIDGGEVDWVAKLTNNQKERTVISGFGTELVQNLF